MLPDGLPQIIGHRGAAAHAPENSLSAFALAATQGADGIECDVHLTADGHIVVLHDDTVDATTDGHGAVAALTLAQIRQLTLRPRGQAASPANTEPIPLLREVIDRFGHGPMTLNIEIKPGATPALPEAVARQLRECDAGAHVLLSSFDQAALAYLQRQHAGLRRALLYPSSTTAGVIGKLLGRSDWLARAQQLGCEAIHPYWQLTNARVITRAHALGLTVNVWTVDDATTARHLAAMSVDGIITNDPARLRQALTGV